MAESPSSAFPGGIEWLPALGGAHVLRAELGRGEPPALLLQSSLGDEHRIEPGPEARFSRTTDYLVPAALRWSVATLLWPDGTRAVLPSPPSERGAVIPLPTRPAPEPERSPGRHWAAPPPGGVAQPAEGETARADHRSRNVVRPAHTVPRPSGAVAATASRSRASAAATRGEPRPGHEGGPTARAEPRPGQVGGETARAEPRRGHVGGETAGTEPRPGDAGGETARTEPRPDEAPSEQAEPRAADVDLAASGLRDRRTALEQDLVRAAEALHHTQESERGDAVLAVLAGAHADLRTARAARAADATLLTTLAAQLEAERRATRAARRRADALRADLQCAHREADALRADLQRAHREADALRADLERAHLQAAALRADQDGAHREEAALRAEFVAHARPGAESLTQLAASQAQAAGLAARPSPAESVRLIAALDAAATSLRTTVVAPSDGPSVARPRTAPALAPPGAPRGPAAVPESSPAPEGAGAFPSLSSELGAASSEPFGVPAPSDATVRRGPVSALPAESSAAPAEPAAVAPRRELAGVPLSSDEATGPPPEAVATPRGDLNPATPARQGGSPARILAPRPAAPPAPHRPGLLHALVALAREDPITAGALLAGLLPAHGAALGEDLSYDVTIRGQGLFAVTIETGEAHVTRIDRRRPNKQARFHLAGSPLALAELLTGERRRITRLRRGPLKANRPRAVRQALPTIPLTFQQAVRAGARFEPGHVYRALPYAVAPLWTTGHAFTVVQEIVELAPRAWYVTARDGLPLTVVEVREGSAADARVTMSRAAFERLLRGEPPAAGDLPGVRGDRTAVAALKRWTELAAGAEG